ncbi:MAG: hypothetical protein HY273_02260 [Gammaproteobacteria bacterium]|nr:hypothetical protein [Gammaproteobacteria bacterium]
MTDRVQVLIAVATRLDHLALAMSTATTAKRDALMFEYIEQAQIYLENIQLPELLERAPEEIRGVIASSTTRLRTPERTDPNDAHATLAQVIPGLTTLYNEFLSQRRMAYIDYHRHLIVIIPRLIGASLTVLVLCIVLGVGLAIWGLRVTRHRLHALQSALSVRVGELVQAPSYPGRHDELDQLDQYLTIMTQRLIEGVAVEKVLQGVEDERRRIAMDMHDGVLADLTALSRTLDRAGSAKEAPSIVDLRTNITELAESIRRVINDLHPQALDILGLEAALRSYLQRHGGASGRAAQHFEFDPGVETALTPSQKINLFRIATEAIHNVIRHAQCNRFEVSIRRVAQRLQLTVEDNGIGMPSHVPEHTVQAGHGCLNITERARAIGAQTAWVASRFSTGTRFELNLPLDHTACRT